MTKDPFLPALRLVPTGDGTWYRITVGEVTRGPFTNVEARVVVSYYVFCGNDLNKFYRMWCECLEHQHVPIIEAEDS